MHDARLCRLVDPAGDLYIAGDLLCSLAHYITSGADAQHTLINQPNAQSTHATLLTLYGYKCSWSRTQSARRQYYSMQHEYMLLLQSHVSLTQRMHALFPVQVLRHTKRLPAIPRTVDRVWTGMQDSECMVGRWMQGVHMLLVLT